MQYMLLIYNDEAKQTEADWDLTPWMAFSEKATKAGVYVAGAGLLPVETATTVRLSDGERLTTDGPFAETKEQLGGYYILDCKDLDEALDWAAQIPSLQKGSVEVRPVFVPEGAP